LQILQIDPNEQIKKKKKNTNSELAGRISGQECS